MSEEVLFCCVCGHNLNSHVSEKTVWRCHALGKDCFQCECALRKDRAENKINYYDLKEREKEWRKEQAKKREGLWGRGRKQTIGFRNSRRICGEGERK